MKEIQEFKVTTPGKFTIFDEHETCITLQPEVTNIILAKECHLTLPEVKELTQLKVLLTAKSGDAHFYSSEPIHYGNLQGKHLMLNPGFPEAETQPTFVYLPQKKAWWLVGNGIAIFLDEGEG